MIALAFGGGVEEREELVDGALARVDDLADDLFFGFGIEALEEPLDVAEGVVCHALLLDEHVDDAEVASEGLVGRS